MKNLLLILLLFTLSFSFAQKRDSVYIFVSKQAEPVGGLKEFYKYFSKNLIIPDSLKREDMTNFSACLKNVSFIVEKDGRLNFLSNPKCRENSLNEIIEKIIKNAPKWKPATHKGRKVRQKYMVSFSIFLE